MTRVDNDEPDGDVGGDPDDDILACADGGFSAPHPAGGASPFRYSNSYPSCNPPGPEGPAFDDS